MIAGVKSYKTRHQLLLPEDLSKKLEALADKAGCSRSTILTDALVAWLNRRGANELDDRFGIRLDGLSRGQKRQDLKLTMLCEALGVFVQYQLTSMAHQPDFDDETGAIGLRRYRSFIDIVGRRFASADPELKLIPKDLGDEE